ncbi:putative thiamine transport system substrate-binding protein [Alteromonas sp. 38]|uniref:ABC transporter substrate-binding protein n=1 Tax=unclassified Alteromonas TaxID=2614992 RepID=UPI0012F1E5EE|nr:MULTISPECIES: ABC transporter substrate-binding protein [unclassified Alteromonas]CAD5272577.1 putative thiamine transport system substrate-binding protein [Alteromonas sp. 154]VXB52764.1 putative thiamine transport system substrate-binding protein [Alteromonas sp. 38]
MTKSNLSLVALGSLFCLMPLCMFDALRISLRGAAGVRVAVEAAVQVIARLVAHIAGQVTGLLKAILSVITTVMFTITLAYALEPAQAQAQINADAQTSTQLKDQPQNQSPASNQILGDAPTVQFHAWGGSAQVNGYIQWVSQQVSKQYNITLNHVKLADTSDAVSRVLAEKAAGNHTQGSVNLIWINGENFAAMKRHNLLLKDWANSIPNFALTNPSRNPAMITDFGIATDGQEAPWGKASMVFYYNHRFVEKPPLNIHELLAFAKQYPGRFTYPIPNDYLGISFLKYAAIALNEDQQGLLYQPVTDTALAKITPALFEYLDALHPLMYKQGDYMLRQASQLQRLMGTSELLLAFSFTAAEIPSAVNRFDLPSSIRTYAMEDGSLANVHFIGITYNTENVEAAKQVVNFLLSPQAQAKKQQLAVWGDDSVLDFSMLAANDKAMFKPVSHHVSAINKEEAVPLFAEPHSSWTDAIRQAWFDRYGERF